MEGNQDVPWWPGGDGSSVWLVWDKTSITISIATIVRIERFFFTLAVAKCVDWTAMRGWSKIEEVYIGCCLFAIVLGSITCRQ